MKIDSILRAQLRSICQRVSIASLNEYIFDGVIYTLNASVITDHEKKVENVDGSQLISHLRAKCYDECYVGYFPSNEDSESFALKHENLTNVFHAANDNKDGWDPGWQIYSIRGDGRVFVQKADRSRVAIAGEYSTYKWPGVAPAIGDFVSIRMFAGTTDAQPSFFFAFGETLSDQFDENALVRFYFNVTASAAVDLMAQITSTLNRYFIPFKFKSLVLAKMYTRADSAVLYVARRYYTIVASLIIDMNKEGVLRLRAGIPLFTCSLVNGVGMAEDLRVRTSFGMHRCGLVAEGIVQAFLGGVQDIEARIDIIEQVFQANGISPEKPYLNPKSNDIFGQIIFDKEIQW